MLTRKTRPNGKGIEAENQGEQTGQQKPGRSGEQECRDRGGRARTGQSPPGMHAPTGERGGGRGRGKASFALRAVESH